MVRTVTDLLRGLTGGLGAAAFPGRCPGCGCPAEPVCPRCLTAFGPAPPAPPPPGVDLWVAPFAYEGVARELVARAKYHGRHAALEWLAASMVEAWHRAGGPIPHLVTWAPGAADHQRAHGFDHGRLLARSVARALGVPARATLARAPGPAQTLRPVSERRTGPALRATGQVSGTVLLVDDVATTGATLRVGAGALLGAGAARVVACTAARTPPDRRARSGPLIRPAPTATGARAATSRGRGATRSA